MVLHSLLVSPSKFHNSSVVCTRNMLIVHLLSIIRMLPILSQIKFSFQSDGCFALYKRLVYNPDNPTSNTQYPQESLAWLYLSVTQVFVAETVHKIETKQSKETVNFRFRKKESQNICWKVIEDDIRCPSLTSIVLSGVHMGSHFQNNVIMPGTCTRINLLNKEIQPIPLWQNSTSFTYEYVKEKRPNIMRQH